MVQKSLGFVDLVLILFDCDEAAPVEANLFECLVVESEAESVEEELTKLWERKPEDLRNHHSELFYSEAFCKLVDFDVLVQAHALVHECQFGNLHLTFDLSFFTA